MGSYAYDTVGNITTSGESGTAQTYNYGVRRAQAVKTVTASGYNKKYLYDKCGNMIVRRGDTAGSQALDYDAENRLVRFSQAGTVIVEYGYAADGMRLWKRVNQDPNKLQVWIGNIYEEKEQGGTRKTLFHVFAGGQRICTFEPTSVLNGGPNPSTTHVGYYYHQDHLGSSSVLSGNTGSQLEVNVHYPFGRTQTANPQAAFKVSNQFTGQVKDEETGLYYYGARYYDPELGRFIQADTVIPDLGNPQSYNRYAYVLNNPLGYTDPDGHQAAPAPRPQIRGVSQNPIINQQIRQEMARTGRNFYQVQQDQLRLRLQIDRNSRYAQKETATPLPSLNRGPSIRPLNLRRTSGNSEQLELGFSREEVFGSVQFQQPPVSNRVGRRGNQRTQDHLDEVRDAFLQRYPEFRHTFGGRDAQTGVRLREEYLPGPGGARKGSSYPDLTFEGPGLTVRVNTVDTVRGSMTQRESDNFVRIMRQTGQPVMAVPKAE